MPIIFARIKKKSRKKTIPRKKIAQRKKKVAEKKKKPDKFVDISSINKINKINNKWIVFYYAVAYLGIFGLFALAIYYSR